MRGHDNLTGRSDESRLGPALGLTTSLKWIEYGQNKEYVMVLSKIVFYLLQDGGSLQGVFE